VTAKLQLYKQLQSKQNNSIST